LRDEGADTDVYYFCSSVLSSGKKAAIISGVKSIPHSRVDQLLSELNPDESKFDLNRIQQFGKDLGELVIPEEVSAALQNMPDHHLVVVNDAAGSRFPWETLQVSGLFPALSTG
jgi:hypothetical protein